MNSYTGQQERKDDPHDLAGLVCNNLGDDTCINPCKGSDSGDTWERRAQFINKVSEEDQ